MSELIFQNKKQSSENDAVGQRKGAALLQDNRGQINQARALTDNHTTQLAQKINNTGLAENLKAGAAASDDRNRARVGALPPLVLQKMEKAFDADFSSVNVFEGNHVTQLGAKAYAHGNDVHFAPGVYNPQSRSGQEIIGHELAHVMQQRSGKVLTQGKASPINTDVGLEREADHAGKAAASGQRAHVAGSNYSSTVYRPSIQGIFTFIFREVGKEVARETAIRAGRHTLEGVLEGLDAQLMQMVGEALRNNPVLRDALRNAQIGNATRDLMARIAAPLSQRLREGVGEALDAIVNTVPEEQREAFRREVEAFKARMRETLGESTFVRILREVFEIAITTAGTVASHMAISRVLSGVQARLVRGAIDSARQVATEHVGDLTEAARTAMEQAQALETLTEHIPDIPLIHRPIRVLVRRGADLVEDALGTANPATVGIRTVDGAREALNQASDDAVDAAARMVEQTAGTGHSARAVRMAGHAVQAAFVLSELSRARTNTQAVVAILKPFVAAGGTMVGGPMGGVAAPVIAEQILLRLEHVIEPTLQRSVEMVQAVPLVGSAVTATYRSAVAIGGGLNAGLSGVVDISSSLLSAALRLVSSSQQSVAAVPRADEDEANAAPNAAELPVTDPGQADIVNAILLHISEQLEAALHARIAAAPRVDVDAEGTLDAAALDDAVPATRPILHPPLMSPLMMGSPIMIRRPLFRYPMTMAHPMYGSLLTPMFLTMPEAVRRELLRNSASVLPTASSPQAVEEVQAETRVASEADSDRELEMRLAALRAPSHATEQRSVEAPVSARSLEERLAARLAPTRANAASHVKQDATDAEEETALPELPAVPTHRIGAPAMTTEEEIAAFGELLPVPRGGLPERSLEQRLAALHEPPRSLEERFAALQAPVPELPAVPLIALARR